MKVVPKEMHFSILEFLSQPELTVTACVSKNWNILSKESIKNRFNRNEPIHIKLNAIQLGYFFTEFGDELKCLNFGKFKVFDRLMAKITCCPNLNHLSISSRQITDVGLSNISGFTNLLTLDLPGCEKITGVGLKHLQPLTNLEKLNLMNNRLVTGS